MPSTKVSLYPGCAEARHNSMCQFRSQSGHPSLIKLSKTYRPFSCETMQYHFAIFPRFALVSIDLSTHIFMRSRTFLWILTRLLVHGLSRFFGEQAVTRSPMAYRQKWTYYCCWLSRWKRTSWVFLTLFPHSFSVTTYPSFGFLFLRFLLLFLFHVFWKEPFPFSSFSSYSSFSSILLSFTIIT